MKQCQAKYGDVFTLVMMGQRVNVVLDSFTWSSVFKKTRELSFPHIHHFYAQRGFGCSYESGEKTYDEQERIFRTMMVDNHLQDIISRSHTKLKDMIRNMSRFVSIKSKPMGWMEAKLQDFISRFAIYAVNESVWGDGLYSEQTLKNIKDYDESFPVLMAGLPNFMAKEGIKAREELCKLFEANTPSGTYYSKNMAAFAQERELLLSQNVSDKERQLGDVAVMWTAHTNTAPSTFWTFAHILSDPQLLSKVQKEVEEVTGGSLPDCAPLCENLSKMQVTHSCFQEAMRMYSDNNSVRRATETVNLKVESMGRAYSIREGDIVMLHFPTVHHDADIYENPDKFQYERFMPSNGVSKKFYKNGKQVLNHLMPYGGGTSMCPGRLIAENEIKLFVCYMLSHFDIQLLDPLPKAATTKAGLGTDPPQNDVRFVFRPKSLSPSRRLSGVCS